MLIGVCVSLGYLYLQSKTYHTFIYQISFKEILFLVLVLMSCIFITILIPIYSSSKNALAGTFDSKKFNYIQVRYKKLKKQNNKRHLKWKPATKSRFSLEGKRCFLWLVLYFVNFVFCKLFTICRQKHGVVRKYPLLYSRFVNKTQKNINISL